MKRLIIIALVLALITGVTIADITWNWSFASESGQFITDGNIGAGGAVAAGTYSLLDGSSSFTVTASAVGSLVGNDYTAGTAYNGDAPFTFNWDGSSITKWDCSGSLGSIRDWLPLRNNTTAMYDYIFGFDDVDKNTSFPGRAALYDNVARSSFIEGDIILVPDSNQSDPNEPDPNEPAPDTSNTVKVYILAGQSNIDGRGINSEFPPELQLTRPDIPIYFIDQWLDLQLGLNTRNPGNLSGPEITFGRSILEKNKGKKIALIKSTKGGSSLYYSWKPGTGPEWNNMVADVSDGMTTLSQDCDPVIVGFIWMQGENDTLNLSNAQAYEQNLTNFIAAVRAEFSVADLPFVIGQISEGPTLTYGEIVRQAQLNVSKNVDNTALVITSDLGLQSDNVHYDTNGVIELGYRFANAMDELDSDVYLADLSKISKDWTSKLSADLYFGQSFDDVNDADVTSPSYVGNFSDNSYQPDALVIDSTYYWRVDINDANGMKKGEIWQFTTGDDNTNIGWWKLDNSMQDFSSYDNDGIAFGEPTIIDDPNWVKCVSFDGDDDYVQIPDEAAFGLTTGITIAAWIRLGTDEEGQYTIVSKGSSFWLYLNTFADRIVFSCEGGGRALESSANVFDGRWHHIAAVFDGTERVIYVDGIRDVSKSSTAPLVLNDNCLLIGNNELIADSKFKGQIREMRIYSSRLPDDVILSLSKTNNYSPWPFNGQDNVSCDGGLTFFPEQWMKNITGDLNGDFVVDFTDFAIYANDWLENLVH